MAFWRQVKRTSRSVYAIWAALAIVATHLCFVIINNEDQLKNYKSNEHLSGHSIEAIELLKNKYIHQPSRNDYNLKNEDHQYNKGEREHGGFAVKVLIKAIFKDQKNGFFIEAGALDGVYLSTTLKLEKENNWTGLLIEPNPASYKLLQQKNRKAWTSNTCISDGNFTKETVLVALSDDDDEFPMSIRGTSYELGNKQLNISYGDFSNKHYVTVQCFPLVTYLLALNIKTVDFLSLDIQGTEKDVLATLPYHLINFRVMVIENLSKKLDTEFISDMKLRGFKFMFNDCENYMFFKEGDSKLDSMVLGRQIYCNYTIRHTVMHM